MVYWETIFLLLLAVGFGNLEEFRLLWMEFHLLNSLPSHQFIKTQNLDSVLARINLLIRCVVLGGTVSKSKPFQNFDCHIVVGCWYRVVVKENET